MASNSKPRTHEEQQKWLSNVWSKQPHRSKNAYMAEFINSKKPSALIIKFIYIDVKDIGGSVGKIVQGTTEVGMTPTKIFERLAINIGQKLPENGKTPEQKGTLFLSTYNKQYIIFKSPNGESSVYHINMTGVENRGGMRKTRRSRRSRRTRRSRKQ